MVGLPIDGFRFTTGGFGIFQGDFHFPFLHGGWGDSRSVQQTPAFNAMPNADLAERLRTRLSDPERSNQRTPTYIPGGPFRIGQRPGDAFATVFCK